MKLSNAQITVLVDRICNDITAKNSLTITEVNAKEDKIIQSLIKSNKMMSTMYNKPNHNYSNYVRQFLMEEYRDKFIEVNKLRIKTVPTYTLKQQVKDEIVFRTIECENLDTLIKEVSNKFIK